MITLKVINLILAGSLLVMLLAAAPLAWHFSGGLTLGAAAQAAQEP